MKKNISKKELEERKNTQMRNKARLDALGRNKIEKLNHSLYETRFTKIAAKYLRTYFVFDLLGCAPVFIYEAMYGFTTDYDRVLNNHIHSLLYNFVFWLKLFKFMAVSTRINDTYNLLFNILKDKFYQKRPQINNVQRITKVVLKTSFGVHVFVCLWLLIHLRQSGSHLRLNEQPSLEQVEEFVFKMFVD